MAGVLSDDQILAFSVKDLAVALSHGRISAVKTLHVFRKRAEVIHAACNAVTCWVEEAFVWAQEADDYLKRTGKVLGPLHGIPFSIKDHFPIKGYPITMGLESLKKRTTKKPPNQDAAIVIVLREAGAIPFCKTSMSQLGDTWSGGNAYGDTLNPWDTLKSPGGSSCGEGALIGGGASPFGIGSDTGGSVRVPGTHCGICAFKPTAQRLTLAWADGRTLRNKDGDYGILPSPGPMAKSVEDLVEVLGALWTERLFGLGTDVPPMPLNRAIFEQKRPLRIGWYIEELTYPKPCPSVVRAMEMAKEALQAAGHMLVPFKAVQEKVCTPSEIWGIDKAMLIFDNSADNLVHLKAASEETSENVGSYGGGPLKGERLHPDNVAAYAVGADVQVIEKSDRMFPKPKTPAAYQKALAKRDRLRDAFWRYWRSLELDVLLCPAWPWPAPPVEAVHKTIRSFRTVTKDEGPIISARLFNMLDCPAGVVPITKVTAEDIEQPYDPSTIDKTMAEGAKIAVANSFGLPVAVQLVSPPWREELCLHAMMEVQRCLPFDTTQHAKLSPVPRRCPDLGQQPQEITVASKL